MSDVEQPVENIEAKTPTTESINQLHAGFNTVIQDFQVNNPQSPPYLLMPVILDIMLGFPYEWLKNMQKSEDFVEAITSEAKAFEALIKIREAEQYVQNAPIVVGTEAPTPMIEMPSDSIIFDTETPSVSLS